MGEDRLTLICEDEEVRVLASGAGLAFLLFFNGTSVLDVLAIPCGRALRRAVDQNGLSATHHGIDLGRAKAHGLEVVLHVNVGDRLDLSGEVERFLCGLLEPRFQFCVDDGLHWLRLAVGLDANLAAGEVVGDEVGGGGDRLAGLLVRCDGLIALRFGLLGGIGSVGGVSLLRLVVFRT